MAALRRRMMGATSSSPKLPRPVADQLVRLVERQLSARDADLRSRPQPVLPDALEIHVAVYPRVTGFRRRIGAPCRLDPATSGHADRSALGKHALDERREQAGGSTTGRRALVSAAHDGRPKPASLGRLVHLGSRLLRELSKPQDSGILRMVLGPLHPLVPHVEGDRAFPNDHRSGVHHGCGETPIHGCDERRVDHQPRHGSEAECRDGDTPRNAVRLRNLLAPSIPTQRLEWLRPSAG